MIPTTEIRRKIAACVPVGTCVGFADTMKPKILVVDDEPSILDNTVYALEMDGFEPTGCATGDAAMAALEEGDFALVVLDVGLPDTNGFELCKRIRARWDVPVIFLTARDGEVDRIVGLEIGADDYVTKPFSPRELSARVKAVLRRCGGNGNGGAKVEAPLAAVGGLPFRVDDERVQITYFGKILALSSTEFRLLRVFCKHPGRVYSRAQLMEIAWEEPEAAMERTVDAHVKSVRAKMKAVNDSVEAIETHRGMGYSLKENW
jgi:two-component system catabolic regulation response regulator CreB